MRVYYLDSCTCTYSAAYIFFVFLLREKNKIFSGLVYRIMDEDRKGDNYENLLPSTHFHPFSLVYIIMKLFVVFSV